ncbi:MAG: lytic transglycosylase domain-containing protein [Clostridiales bacterium]|nr:lytic transglycosylase domain-containing protein [Clostridiales bacterium]
MFYAISVKKLILPAAAVLGVLLAGCGTAYVLWRYPTAHLEQVNRYAGAYGLSPSFALAVIHAESKFDRQATSSKGASGLMQIRQGTADWLAGDLQIEGYDYSRIYEPEINIRLGCYYLSKLYKQFGGSLELTLAAYNAGEGNVAKWLLDKRCSDDGKTLKYIPFKETRVYISRVKTNMRIYNLLLKLKGIEQ